MNDMDTSLRLMVILARPDSDSFDTSATAVRYAAEGVDITLVTAAGGQRNWSRSPREVVTLESVGGDLEQVEPEQIVCELVAHIRRVQPHVVITSGPLDRRGDPDRLVISQLATAAVMRAADPRYGHTCCSRRPHAVSKLYYTAAGDHHDTHRGRRACAGRHLLSSVQYRQRRTRARKRPVRRSAPANLSPRHRGVSGRAGLSEYVKTPGDQESKR